MVAGLLVALGVVVLVGLAIRFALTSRQLPSPQETAVERALPTPVPYEFVWLPGATRGVDLPQEIYIESIGKRLPLMPVGDLKSTAGEGKVDFLQRVRKAMVDYSDRQTFEACALICSDGTGHSVRMTSVGAVAYCAVAPVCMSGHASVRETIHSHCPKRRRLRATMADEFLSGWTIRRNTHFGACDPNGFSSVDFAGWRPGWLAGVDALYRHDGPSEITSYQ